jgi:hypothetical protein
VKGCDLRKNHLINQESYQTQMEVQYEKDKISFAADRDHGTLAHVRTRER